MAPGQTVTVFRPKIWFAKNWGVASLPIKNLAAGADWNTKTDGTLGTDWTLIDNTANGAQWTFVNPKQDITTDEHGIIDVIASGADTINVTLQSRTPFPDLIQKAGGMAKNSETATTDVRDLTLTSGISSTGSFTITLNGVVYTVAGASSVSQNTSTTLATYLRTAGNYSPTLAGVYTLGGTGSDVTYTAVATGFQSGAYSLQPASTGAAGTFSTLTMGQPAMDRYNLDPDADNYFMLGMEGTFQANSLKTLAGRARIIAYKVQQTENPQMHWRTRGNDSLLQPVLTARCLNSVVASGQLTNTGYTASGIDSLGRLDWWIV